MTDTVKAVPDPKPSSTPVVASGAGQSVATPSAPVAAKAAKAPDAPAPPKSGPDVILTKAPNSQPEPSPEAVAAEIPISQRIEDFCNNLVLVEKQGPASKFSHRGVCKKCGWQSFQYTEVDAKNAVFNHAAKHWNEAR